MRLIEESRHAIAAYKTLRLISALFIFTSQRRCTAANGRRQRRTPRARQRLIGHRDYIFDSRHYRTIIRNSFGGVLGWPPPTYFNTRHRARKAGDTCFEAAMPLLPATTRRPR